MQTILSLQFGHQALELHASELRRKTEHEVFVTMQGEVVSDISGNGSWEPLRRPLTIHSIRISVKGGVDIYFEVLGFTFHDANGLLLCGQVI